MKNNDYDPKYYTFEFGVEKDAEDTLNSLRDILNTYGVVSVADLFDLLDQQHSYTATKYGWINLNEANIVRNEWGFALELPRAVSIV